MCNTSKCIVLILLVIYLGLAYSDCTRNKPSEVRCSNLTSLSGLFVNETLTALDSIKHFIVRNNGNNLDLSSSSFDSMVRLEKVAINFSNLTTIYAGTFKNLRVTRIDLSYNEIDKIYPKTFLNLTNIDKILCRHNKLPIVNKNVFVNMPLTTLTLSHNVISSVEDSSLENLHNLKKLHLDNNKISSIYPHKFLSNPEILQILWLHNNSIKGVTANMLQGLTNLKIINLSFNKINMIEENTFEETPLLETLVLSKNELKQVDGSIFPRLGMTNLEQLYLDNNRLMYLTSNFLFKLRSLKSVTLVGNPWFCICLDVVHRLLIENAITEKCNEKYVSGNRPLCVADHSSSQICKYKYNETLSVTFYTYQENNPIFVKTIECIL